MNRANLALLAIKPTSLLYILAQLGTACASPGVLVWLWLSEDAEQRCLCAAVTDFAVLYRLNPQRLDFFVLTAVVARSMLSAMKILDIPRSGSVAGTTSSRNRNGQYVRSRATPVQPRTASQVVQRAHQSQNAAAWRTLTDNQRAGWSALGTLMTRSDALGQAYNLTGFQAYCSVNNTLLATGGAVVSDSPALITPTSITTATVTLTHIAFSIAFTPTPLPALTKVIVRCSPQRSAGRKFEGDYRIVLVGAAATASPADVFSAYSAKFGVPVTGNRIFISLTVMVGGFESGSFVVSQVVA